MTARVVIEVRIDSHRIIFERGTTHEFTDERVGVRTAHALARELLKLAESGFQKHDELDSTNRLSSLNSVHVRD